MLYVNGLEIKTDYAEAWNYKGFALFELGHPDQALKAFGKALQVFERTDSPHTDRGRKALAKIKSQK